MVIPSILVLCVASSTDASDQVLDLPEVVVQPSLIPGLLTFDRSPSLAQSHIQLDPTDFQIDRSLPEVMQAFPGVQVQKTGHGQGSPFLRGFTGQRTVLLVDGIRFDDTVFREGPVQYWNTLDPESFAEILFSPGLRSASAGSGAIGGVVELISSQPDPSSSWGGLVRGRLSSAEQSSGGRLHVSGGDGAIGLECGVHLRSFGDLRTGQGVQPRTGYGTSGLDFRLAWQSGGVDWTVGHDRSRVDDAWRTHSTIYGQPFEGTTIGSDLRRVLDHRRERTILTGSTRDLCALDHVSWTFSRQVQSESRDRVRSDGRRDLQGFDLVGLGFSVHAAKDNWSFGVDSMSSRADSERLNFASDGSFVGASIQGPIGDDSGRDLIEGYVAKDQSISSEFESHVAARWSSSRVFADRVADPASDAVLSMNSSLDGLSTSCGVRWTSPNQPTTTLEGRISTGVRLPNLADFTRFDVARSGEVEIPAFGLDPEEFAGVEASIREERDSWSWLFTAYFTAIDGMIIRRPTGDVIDGGIAVTKQNAGDGRLYGVEGSLTWSPAPNLMWRTQFSAQRGDVDTFPTSEDVSVNEPISRLAPALMTSTVRWFPHGAPWHLEGRLRWSDLQDRLSSRDRADTQRIPEGGTPGWTVLDLGWGVPLDHGSSVGVALENVFDVDYRRHGSGVNEPGRNLVVRFERSF